jgi:PTH2 family peptidyl-tRNA hydrolase
MYLFVNSGLQMGKGKISAQVGHCVQYLLEDIFNNIKSEKYKEYLKWKTSGCKKIVLKATQEQLIELQKDNNSKSVYDAGHTQIPEGSLTVVGFFPSDKLENKFKHYKLL